MDYSGSDDMMESIRVALWAARAARSVDTQLEQRVDLRVLHVPRPPNLQARAGRGMHAYLRRSRMTCLVRALVVQEWEASQGNPRELVIGVTAPGPGFAAHAWLDGDDPCHDDSFNELARRPPA